MGSWTGILCFGFGFGFVGVGIGWDWIEGMERVEDMGRVDG